MEISFIIPVYNGEKTLEQCVESIGKWHRDEEIEIIIVNDGSTDNTGKVCDEISVKDKRVRVFHVINGGPATARNYGIQAAKGKYIAFADADDQVEVEGIYEMWQKAEAIGADVVMGGYCRIGPKGKEEIHVPWNGIAARIGTKAQVDLYNKIKTESMFGYMWNKLYAKDFLMKHHIDMVNIKEINMEDFIFNMKVWSHRPLMYCVDCIVYTYRADNISMTRSPDPFVHIKSGAMLKVLIDDLKKTNALEKNLDMVIPAILRCFCWSLIKNVDSEPKAFRQMIKRIKYFVDNETIKEVLAMDKRKKALKTLEKSHQRLFYRLCLFGIRHHKVYCLGFGFYLLCPMLKIYAGKVVK